jgi:predicted nucleotidyltransferase
MLDTDAMGAEAILDRLRGELAGARFAYVFGSIVTGAFGDESDVDVAVDFGEPLTPTGRIELAAVLAAAAGRDVDVVDLRASDPVIKMQVLKYGRLLLANDQPACYSFAMNTLSEYIDLKLDRAPVEAMIARSHAPQG